MADALSYVEVIDRVRLTGGTWRALLGGLNALSGKAEIRLNRRNSQEEGKNALFGQWLSQPFGADETAHI